MALTRPASRTPWAANGIVQFLPISARQPGKHTGSRRTCTIISLHNSKFQGDELPKAHISRGSPVLLPDNDIISVDNNEDRTVQPFGKFVCVCDKPRGAIAFLMELCKYWSGNPANQGIQVHFNCLVPGWNGWWNEYRRHCVNEQSLTLHIPGVDSITISDVSGEQVWTLELLHFSSQGTSLSN